MATSTTSSPTCAEADRHLPPRARPSHLHTGRAEVGAGVIGTVVGVFVFLALLLFAVQVLVGLHATTVVTAVAYDAAKTVAGADAASASGGGRGAARARATADARRRLGRVGDDASFTWSATGDAVVLTVRAPRPRVLPAALVGGVAPPDVVRTVRVRVEAIR